MLTAMSAYCHKYFEAVLRLQELRMQKSLVVQSLAKGKHIGFSFCFTFCLLFIITQKYNKITLHVKIYFSSFPRSNVFGFLIYIIFLPVRTDYLEKGNFLCLRCIEKLYTFHFVLSFSSLFFYFLPIYLSLILSFLRSHFLFPRKYI